jgi:hypothetical protein
VQRDLLVVPWDTVIIPTCCPVVFGALVSCDLPPASNNTLTVPGLTSSINPLTPACLIGRGHHVTCLPPALTLRHKQASTAYNLYKTWHSARAETLQVKYPWKAYHIHGLSISCSNLVCPRLGALGWATRCLKSTRSSMG